MSRNFDFELRCESERVLATEAFIRSPVQSRLLRYLVERTLSPRRDAITQFDIATEGLGKSEDYDESTESYVRVHISRLRKSLASHYALHQPSNGGAIHIKPGHYDLSLASIDVAYPGLSVARPPSTPPVAATPEAPDAAAEDGVLSRAPSDEHWLDRLRSKRTAFALGMALVISVGLLGAPRPSADQGGSVSATSSHDRLERPKVQLNVEGIGYFVDTKAGRNALEAVVLEATERLERSVVATVAENAESYTYRVEVLLDGVSPDNLMMQINVTDAGGEIIHQREDAVTGNLALIREQAGWDLAEIVSPPGVISRHMVQEFRGNPESDFECFLFVEIGRSSGAGNGNLLKDCESISSSGEFYPFLRARRLFANFQNEIMTEGQISEDSENWEALGEALRKHPDNPYLNTVAAKLLYARSFCEEAAFHEERALFKGRDYPALHLAILVEKYPCLKDDASKQELVRNVVSITSAQTAPHALLEAFAVSSLLVIKRKDLVRKMPDQPFAFERDQPLVKFTRELRRRSEDPAAPEPQAFRALIWNPESRALILSTT